jgi:hypothetical protein
VELVTIRTNLQNPTIAREVQEAVNTAVVGVSFTTTLQRSALILQAAKTLLILAINDTGGQHSPAAYEENSVSMRWIGRIVVYLTYKGDVH